MADGNRPGYVVFRKLGDDRWELVGEASRRPGLTARRARAQAVRESAGREIGADETYAAVLRSEWRIALEV
jgi:hypothetical protein